MPGKVADACVLAAILFEEPQGRPGILARRRQRTPRTQSDCLRVDKRRAQEEPQSPRAAAAALRDTRAGLANPMTWAAVDHTAVLDLSLAARISSYDATYLHMAQSLQLPLATLDHKLRRAAVELGIPTVDG